MKLRQYFLEYNSIYLIQPIFNAAFFGLKSIFVLYVISQFSLSEGQAISLFATFMSLCYGTSLVGGYVADNGLGVKNTATFGGFLTSLGLLCVLFPLQELYYLGLALVSLGSGCFKPNLLASVGLLFKDPKDPKKDKAYSVVFMAMNLGTLVFPIICGFVGNIYGLKYSIILVALMFAGATYFYHKTMKFHPSNEETPNFFHNKLLWGLLFLIALLFGLFKYRDLFHGMMGIIAIGSIAYFAKIFVRCDTPGKKGVLIILAYILMFAILFTIDEQAGSSMLLFYERAVDRQFMGITIPASAFLSLNPLFVLLCGPLLIFLSSKYLEKTKPINGFVKSGCGFLLTAVCLWILVWSINPDNTSHISPLWVIFAILFQTIGELWIVPIGLSQISQHSPPHLQSVMMSFWTMSLAYGHYFAGFIAQFSMGTHATIESPFAVYRKFFFYLGLMPSVIGLLILIIYQVRLYATKCR